MNEVEALQAINKSLCAIVEMLTKLNELTDPRREYGIMVDGSWTVGDNHSIISGTKGQMLALRDNLMAMGSDIKYEVRPLPTE